MRQRITVFVFRYNLENQIESALTRFEQRVKHSGLIIWFRLFWKKLIQLKEARKAKEKAIYGELMQIESIAKECEPSESSARLIEKIQKLKGIISVLCLSAVLSGMLPGIDIVRHMHSSRAKIGKKMEGGLWA